MSFLQRSPETRKKEKEALLISMARQIGMFSVRLPDGQFGSELINGLELETQTFPTGILQLQWVSREVYFSKFVLFDKRKGGSLDLK